LLGESIELGQEIVDLGRFQVGSRCWYRVFRLGQKVGIEYLGRVRKLISIFNSTISLMLIIYDVITIAKILFFLVVYLRIEIIISISSIIDYRNESINFGHFVLKA